MSGTPLFAGYDDRVARFAAAAEEQRARAQGRETERPLPAERAAEPAPEVAAGEDRHEAARRMSAEWYGPRERTPGRAAGTDRAGDVGRGAAGGDERVAGAEYHDARQRTEHHAAEPAEPALDPQRVWGHLTAQERYEAETDRPHAERGRRPAPARQPSRDLQAGELERSHAARDPRLEADLAMAREAAERLAGKQEAQREWTTDEEIDYILRRARGELREGEQPPPRVEQEFQKYQQSLQQEQQRGLGREM